MSAHETALRNLEPLAEQYVGTNRVRMFTPILAGYVIVLLAVQTDTRSIFCGVTWGVLGLQYVKWVARGAKGQSVWTMTFAVS